MLIDKIKGLRKQSEEVCARSKFAELLIIMISTAHLWHFKTLSFSQHKAFEDFYTGLNDLADSYIEADMGVNGIIEDTGLSHSHEPVSEAKSSLMYFRDSVKSERDLQESLGENGLVAILEEIMSLIDSTVYKISLLN